MMKSLQIIALTVAVCSLSSCNTFIGMGKDVQSLGRGMVNTGHGTSWSKNQAPAAPQAPPQTPPPPVPAQ